MCVFFIALHKSDRLQPSNSIITFFSQVFSGFGSDSRIPTRHTAKLVVCLYYINKHMRTIYLKGKQEPSNWNKNWKYFTLLISNSLHSIGANLHSIVARYKRLVFNLLSAGTGDCFFFNTSIDALHVAISKSKSIWLLMLVAFSTFLWSASGSVTKAHIGNKKRWVCFVATTTNSKST